MKALHFVLVVLFIGIFCSSCDRPDCVNNNAVFDQHPADAQVYKDELARQLSSVDQSKLRTWLKDYTSFGSTDHLHFYIQGEGLCAELYLSVNDWTKLEDIRQRRGKSYFNAEFVNLQFDIIQSNGQTTFLYKTFDRILD